MEGGAPLSAHLEQLKRSKGEAVETGPENDCPFPDDLEFIWITFCKLASARSYGMESPNPISFQDIWCYSALNGIELDAWELDTIKKLDAKYIELHNARTSRTHAENKIAGGGGSPQPARKAAKNVRRG